MNPRRIGKIWSDLEREFIRAVPRDDLLQLPPSMSLSSSQTHDNQLWKQANGITEQPETDLTLQEWKAIMEYIYNFNATFNAESKHQLCVNNNVLDGMAYALYRSNPALTEAQAEQKCMTFDKPYLERIQKGLPFRWIEWVEYDRQDFTLGDSESTQGSLGPTSDSNNPFATSRTSGGFGIEGHGQATPTGPNQPTGQSQLNFNAVPYKHASYPPVPSSKGEQALPPTYYQYLSPPPPYVPTSVAHDQVKSQGSTQTVIKTQPSFVHPPFATPSSSEPPISHNSFSKPIFQHEFDMKQLGGAYEWENCLEWVCCWGEKFSAWMDKRDRERGFIRTKFSIPQPSRRPVRRRPCPCEGGTGPHMKKSLY